MLSPDKMNRKKSPERQVLYHFSIPLSHSLIISSQYKVHFHISYGTWLHIVISLYDYGMCMRNSTLHQTGDCMLSPMLLNFFEQYIIMISSEKYFFLYELIKRLMEKFSIVIFGCVILGVEL